jgi:hypothetical protein
MMYAPHDCRSLAVFAVAPVLLVAFTAIATGQEARPYQPAGAPADPKVPARWNRYHDYTEASNLLAELAKAHPERARLESLGKSYGGREMWVLTVTNFGGGPIHARPAFWIDGGIHANEIQATEVVLYTGWYLLETYERQGAIRRLLDERVFYLMPMLSPDGRDAHFYKPNTTHSPRSGLRPFDDDRDGLVDEDGPDDLDGDGHITQMRVADKNGGWKRHPDYPDLLVSIKPGEQGEYRLLGAEGFDNDGDGRVNEDGDGFYDPNRDWGWNWEPRYVQNGAHRYPFSILENRMAADFIISRRHIAGAQSYHNTGGMILRGPGAKSDRFEASDLRVYDALGKRGEEMLPGYKYLNTANDLYEVYGGEKDWLHQVQGVFAFTNELFTAYNFFRKPVEGGFFGNEETRRQFSKLLLLDDGIAPWREADHPQYGKIEIGGIKKNWVRQPPSFLLEEECHRNMAFTLYHAHEMPRVRVQSVEAERLAGGLTQVTAIVQNERLTPTHSAADLARKITPPDIVALAGKDVRVVLGLTSEEPYFLRPGEAKREPARLRVPVIPGHGVVYARWLVEGDGPFTVSVESIKGGRHSLASD